MNRIVRTNTIRCGYLLYSSYFRKDPNTGKFSGLFYDIMEQVGKNSGLKIEWTEEVGYENIFPALESGRFDVFASGLWSNASRAKAAAFSMPVCFSPITAWCRTADSRFDQNIMNINSPSIKIAAIDGAMEDILAKSLFPNAARVSLPELSPFSQNLLNISTKKADVSFAEPMVVHEFLATNPGTLKQINAKSPLRIFGNSLVVKRSDTELKTFLDTAIQELINSSQMDTILAKYNQQGTTFYPWVKQFEVSSPPKHQAALH